MQNVISVQQGDTVVPIVPQAQRFHPGLSSRGIMIEQHRNGPMAFPERHLLQHNLFLHTGAAVRADLRSTDVSGLRWIRPGTLWVMPQGSRHQVTFHGRTAGIALAFSAKTLATLLEEVGQCKPHEIMETLSVGAPRIDHLMRALVCDGTELGAECIATAIALTLTESTTPKLRTERARLTPRQVRTVMAYVEDNLQQSIVLGDLAAVVGLSSFHFLRAFRESLGVTPRQYVLDRRIELATILLRESRLRVTEVSVRAGFQHASHFTRAFSAKLGLPPLQYRREAQE